MPAELWRRGQSEVFISPLSFDIDGYCDLLQNIDGYCDLLQNIDGYCDLLQNIDGYCDLLQNIDGYCDLLQNIDGYCDLLQNIDGYCDLLQNIDGYCDLLQNIVGYCDIYSGCVCEGVSSAMNPCEDTEPALNGDPERLTKAQREDQQSSEVPRGQSAQQHQTQLDSTLMLLEDNIITFVKNELKKIQKALRSDYPEFLESQSEDEEVLDGEDEEQRRSSREAFLNITLHFLRSMKQEELADRLQSSKRVSIKI
ncbi:hypothetical protein F7725_023584 [Dissostichus mawsoni]|uniref:Uncharacterized protein n=1 Tax=Dissostichus mawsoni TaxID=36200 RepID=A0A7J5XXT1_DISMA|nr:hypothetical protein F7725_023584 [Dissostichus mawsoni]